MASEPFDGAESANSGSLGDRLDDLLIRAENRLAGWRIGIVASLAVALAGAAAFWALTSSGSVPPVEDSIPLAGSTSLPPAAPPAPGGTGQESVGAAPDPGPSATSADDRGAGEEDDQEVVVHVIGAVGRPGLVVLRSGDRISDAVDAAGGGWPDADLERLNLATLLVDGMQIRVPVRDEQPDSDEERPLVQLPAAVASSGGGAGPGEDGGERASEPVDLNQADEVELQRLPGIGPALAGRIIVWRSENGGFTSVDELEAVPGIGPATMADLLDLVTV